MQEGNKLKKEFIYAVSASAITALICSSIGFARGDVKVIVNGAELNDEAFIENDRTYIPLRAVGEALGAQVDWDNETRSAIVNTPVYAAPDDEDIEAFLSDVSKSVVAIVGSYKPGHVPAAVADYNDSMAHGTGVVIKSSGSILTNAHVVSDIDNITVIFSDGTSYAGSVQYIDEASDLAVVKINKLGLRPITIAGADSLKWGQTVYAIGTPLSLTMQNTVTKGIVGGLSVNVYGSTYPLIQTDAAINSGNSGGPLINSNGELVGINSSKYAGVGIEGLAFSIPVKTINYVLGEFEKNGAVLRPDLQIELENSREALRGLPTQKGLTVKSSSNGILQSGDIVTAVNGIPVHSIIDYNTALRDTYSNGDVQVTYTRNGAENTVSITPVLK